VKPGTTNSPNRHGTTSEMVNQILSTWSGQVDQLTPEQYSAILKLTEDDPSTLTPSQKNFVVKSNLRLLRENGLPWLQRHKLRLGEELELIKNDL
jgi:hypothetical protein